jgi:hypothetical protein
MKLARRFASGLCLMCVIDPSLAQNPDTDCATVVAAESEGDVVCIPQACEYACQKSTFEDDGFTFTYCNCGGLYSSTCCQLFFGVGATGTCTRPSGDCNPNCGPGGICVIVPFGTHGFAAECFTG